jgi:hypothetical protein
VSAAVQARPTVIAAGLALSETRTRSVSLAWAATTRIAANAIAILTMVLPTSRSRRRLESFFPSALA